MKGVFDTKANSVYDDEITRRYQFPRQYRAVAEKLVGDWVIYREPQRNGGRKTYMPSRNCCGLRLIPSGRDIRMQ